MGKPIYKQLDELYKAEWAKISKDIEPYKDIVSIPFLPTTQKAGGSGDESWWTKAKLRVMIFGRETGENYNTPLSQVEGDLFAEAGEVYAQWNSGVLEQDIEYGFFGAFNYFSKKLPQAAVMWNNLDLVAMEKKDGSLNKENQAAYEIQAKFSSAVLPKMLEYLKPHIVIFLTADGSDDEIKNRDAIIMRNFGVTAKQFEAVDDGIPVTKLMWINGFDKFGTLAYRAKHPCNGLANDVKDAIIADIKENFK